MTPATRVRDVASVTPPPPTGSRSTTRVWLRRVVVGLLLVVTLGVGADWGLHQSPFRVHTVTMTGLHHETRANVLRVSGLSTRPALIDLSGATIARRIEGLTWVRSVRVGVHWPSTVSVAITERVPVAVAYNARHALQLVDATGRDLGPASLTNNLPLLVTSYRHHSWPFASRARSAALVAGALPPAFSAQVVEVDLRSNGDVVLDMTTPVTFNLGAPTDLSAKFASIAAVIAHVTLKPGDVVDVSVPGTLTVTSGK